MLTFGVPRHPIDVTLTVADDEVRLTGPELDVSDAHSGVRPGLAAAVHELRAARVHAGIAQRTAPVKDLVVDRAAGLLSESFLPPAVGQALSGVIQAARTGNVAVRLGVQASGVWRGYRGKRCATPIPASHWRCTHWSTSIARSKRSTRCRSRVRCAS